MQIEATSNHKQVMTALTAVRDKGYNLHPVFREIANLLENTAEHAFETETSAVDGQAWQPLSEATLSAKKGKGKILYHKGTMQDSLTSMATLTSAVIGTNAISDDGYPYPAAQQFGTKDGHIPARAFLPFDDQGDVSNGLRDDIMNLVTEHFNQ